MTIHDALYTSRSEEWPTPPAFFNKLNEEFHFSLDPCATAQNARSARYSLRKIPNGLLQDWGLHNVFFAIRLTERGCRDWARKCYEASHNGALVVLTCARPHPHTRWFHDWVYGKAAEMEPVRGRLKFGDGKQSAPFPSLVSVFKPQLTR